MTQLVSYNLNFKTKEPTGGYASATTATIACITTKMKELLA